MLFSRTYTVLIIWAFVSLFLVGCAKSLTEDTLKPEIDKLLSENKVNDAEFILKGFLADNGNSHVARELLSNTFIIRGKYLNGIQQINKLESKRYTDQSNDLLMEAYYLLGFDEEATELYKNILSKESLSRADYIYALIQIRNGNKDEVTNTMGSKLPNNASSDTSIETLFRYSLRLNDATNKEEFESKIDALNDDNKLKNWPIFQSVAASYYYNDLDYQKAEIHFDTYIAQRPHHYQVYLTFIDSLIKQENYQKANKLVNYILNINPSQPIANQQKSQLLLNDNLIEEANVFLAKAINNGYESRENYLAAGLINFQLENYEQAIKNLSRGLQGSNNYSDYHVMLDYSVARTSQSGAASITDTSITSLADVSKVKALLSGYKDAANTEKMQQLVQQLTVSNSVKDNVKLEVALLDTTNNIDISQLVTLAKNTISNNGQEQSLTLDKAKIVYISFLVQKNELKQAAALINDWIVKSNYSMVDTLLLVDVLRADGLFDEALLALNNALGIRELTVYYNRLANIHYSKQEYQLSFEAINKALKRVPYSIEYLRQYVALQNKIDVPNLDTIELVYGDYASVENSAIFYAYYYEMVGNVEAAIKKMTDLSSENKSTTYYVALTRLYAKSNNKQKVRETLEQIVKDGSPDLDMVEQITLLMQENSTLDLAISFYQQLSEAYPSNVKFIQNLASLYLANKEPQKAADLLAKSSNQDEKSQQLSAISNRNLGNLNAANAMFKSTYEKYGSKSSLSLYANHLYTLGDAEAASSLIATFLESDPDSKELQLLLASKSSTDVSIPIYENVISRYPDDVHALTNLAWQLHQSGDTAKAKPFIQKAIALAPTNKGVQDTYNEINQ